MAEDPADRAAAIPVEEDIPEAAAADPAAMAGPAVPVLDVDPADRARVEAGSALVAEDLAALMAVEVAAEAGRITPVT
jgi:hypothetical protein